MLVVRKSYARHHQEEKARPWLTYMCLSAVANDDLDTTTQSFCVSSSDLAEAMHTGGSGLGMRGSQ